MKRIINKTLLTSVLLLSFCMSTPAFAIDIGATAPDFTLTDIDGNQHNLSDFKGKTVVLEWLSHSCPFVKKHYESNNMQGLQEKYTKADVVWLSINSSAANHPAYKTPAEEKALKEKVGSKATAILSDASGKVGRMYGAKTTPHMFIIDAEGVLRYQGAIDSINSTDSEDVAKATNYVSAALDELAAGKAVSKAETSAYGCSVKYG